MNFREYITEEFDQSKAVKDALVWLKSKYQDKFTFKHIEGMTGGGENAREYDINVGDNVYHLSLKKFDSNGDGQGDTIGFNVKPVVPNTVEPEIEF